MRRNLDSHSLGVASIRLVAGIDDAYSPGITAPSFGGAVAPVWMPASAVGALCIARLTRPKESPLRRRGAVGVEVPRTVGKKLAKGSTHPPDGGALGLTPGGRRVSISDAESRHHVTVCGAPGSGKTTVVCHLLDGRALRHPVLRVDCKASQTLRHAIERIPSAVV